VISPIDSPLCPETEIRLDAPGGPLELSPVQDQDSLAICYANASTLLLQSAMPNHPELSAIDLSIQTYQKSQIRKEKGLRYELNDNLMLFNELGHVCDVVNTVKKFGACPRKFSKIESGKNLGLGAYSDPSDAQSAVLNAVASFVDYVGNKEKKSPGFEAKLAESVPELRELYKKNLEESRTKKPVPQDHLKKHMLTIAEQAFPGTENAEKKKNAIDAINGYYADQTYSNDLNWGSANDIIDNHIRYFESMVPELKGGIENSKEEFARKIDSDKNAKRINDPTFAFWNDLDKHLKKSSKWTNCQSDAESMVSNLSGVASSFGDAGAFLEFDLFLKGLANPDLNLILGSIAPECLDSKNRISLPPNLSCMGYDIPDPKPTFDKKGDLNNFEQIMSTARNRILWSINDKKRPMPVTMSVCSAIIHNKDLIYTHNNSENECAEAGGSSHSVTVIGARKNKKTRECEYLIQNSWGGDCSNVGDRECQNGKIWMDEKQLLFNAKSIEKIVEDKK